MARWAFSYGQGARCEPLFQNTRCVEQSGGAVELRTCGYKIGKVGAGGGFGALGGENRWTQKGRVKIRDLKIDGLVFH